MQTNLLWTGREYHSLENCLVTKTDSGFVIASTIVGYYEGRIYKVEYQIKTNLRWETLLVEINSRHSDQAQNIRMEGDGKGKWMREGKEVAQYTGCIDIDIPLTPFTNTLPINRLRLEENQTAEIKVLYLDLLSQQIIPVKQKYVRLPGAKYHYENIPNDFEADIAVDESGFVADYPSLFVRTASLKSNYP